jgi:hypothetical protein
VRSAAFRELEKFGGEKTLEALIGALESQSENDRKNAAQALGAIGDKRAVAHLIRRLDDKSVHVKISAARSLGEIGDERAVDVLIDAFKSWYVGAKDAGVALGKIGAERGRRALRDCMVGSNDKLRVVAADSLLEIGELTPAGDVEGFFISEPPEGDGLCSDNQCPCPGMGAHIPRGKGFLYISGSVVHSRKNARTEAEAENKLARDRMSRPGISGPLGMTVVSQGAYSPILCCRKGAEKRRLDLEVAAQDAAFWWKYGLVPLRSTPLEAT